MAEWDSELGSLEQYVAHIQHQVDILASRKTNSDRYYTDMIRLFKGFLVRLGVGTQNMATCCRLATSTYIYVIYSQRFGTRVETVESRLAFE